MKNGHKRAKLAEVPLYCSLVPPELTSVSVNTQGAFIQHYTVLQYISDTGECFGNAMLHLMDYA